MTHPLWAVFVLLVASSFAGCGTGILGDDDVQPGACSVGPAVPLTLDVPVPEESANRPQKFTS